MGKSITETSKVIDPKAEALKKQYGKISIVKVAVAKNGEGEVTDYATVYCKEPDRNVVALAMSKRSQNKVLEAGEAILDNTMLDGSDERVKTIDKIRIAAALKAFELLDFLEATVEEA